MSLEPVLIAGEWRESEKTGTFQAANPATGESLPPLYPISSWADCEAALESAHAAYLEMRSMPGEKIATFLEAFAVKIEERAEALVDLANLETALPKTPRLAAPNSPAPPDSSARPPPPPDRATGAIPLSTPPTTSAPATARSVRSSSSAPTISPSPSAAPPVVTLPPRSLRVIPSSPRQIHRIPARQNSLPRPPISPPSRPVCPPEPCN